MPVATPPLRPASTVSSPAAEHPTNVHPVKRSTCPHRPQAYAGPLPQWRGFALIELLIALLISALLCVLAWPRLEALLHQARRSEAHTALTGLLHAQTRYRSSHRHYARSLAELGMAGASLRHYQVQLLGLPPPDAGSAVGDPFQLGFVAVATPLPGSTQMRDAPCAELRLTLDGRQVSQTAADRAGNAADACWPH